MNIADIFNLVPYWKQI